MKNSIRIVDNLAEITSHHDRHVLEKSLLKTLSESFPNADLRLFRVKEYAENHELTLLAFCVNSVIVSSVESPKLLSNDSGLSPALTRAISQSEIDVSENEKGGWYSVYPAFDSHGDIYAVLLAETELQPSPNDQRLVFGILKVYSNYLALIEKTQKDKLTGLFNRETLDDEVTKTLVRQSNDLIEAKTPANDSRRRAHSIKHWLGVIDIDHFKLINDTYGHLYGDEVIILVARLMTSGCIRDDDLVYRYGGEEFVVLLKAPTEEDALQTFERIRSMIAEHHFPQLKQVTVSIGFVEISGQQSPSDAIGEADEALYYAKQNGRNQVQSYQQLISTGKIQSSVQLAQGDVELF